MLKHITVSILRGLLATAVFVVVMGIAQAVEQLP